MESSEAPKKFPLKREEAEFRKSELTDSEGEYFVDYNLVMTLRKSTDRNTNYENNNFEGRLTVTMSYFGKTEEDLFLNFYGDVHSVSINGLKVETVYKDRRIYLDRSKLIKSKNDLNKITILFSAKYDKGGVALHHFIDPIDKREYLYTQFEPYSCHLVFPVFDQPDIKATLTMTLAGPEDWVLLTNEYEKWTKNLNDDEDVKNYLESHLGLNTEESAFLFGSVSGLGYKLSPFGTTNKISSYLYAICAGPFYCYTDKTKYKVPLRVFMRESLKDCGEVEEFFRITIAGMEWYKEFFGLEYPFSKYDQIYCPEYNYGAMENVGLVTYNEAYCWKDSPTQQRRARFCITVLHELAHMWFGNLVTMKWWDDLWLNESFATFISHLCQEQTLNETYPTSWIAFNMYKGIAFREDQKVTTHPVFGDIVDTDKCESHFDAIVYYKGSSLLKQMFYFIGQENFSNGLKEYFKKFAWTNTVFNDFVDKMVEAIHSSNKQVNFDLKALSNKWLLEAGLNQVELVMEESEGKITNFDLKQTPCMTMHQNLQVHMMDVLFIYDNESKEHKNILVNAAEITSLNSLVGLDSPRAVILNYNDWAYFKWIVDQKSFAYLKDNLIDKVPDVLTRLLFYRSILEQTRDARISCPEYLDMISKLLRHETDDEIISTTIRNISGLIAYYLPLRVYPHYADLMFKLVSELIGKNINNKEIVLNLVECLILFAYTDEHREILKEWLVSGPSVHVEGNKVEIPPTSLSQDNRFSIVAFIYSGRSLLLQDKENLLQAEVERDKNSDRSSRARCRCRAALPDAEVKAEIWNKFIHQPTGESLYNMKSYMSSFESIDQLDLVENYLKKKFFEDAPLIANQEHFYVDAFLSYLAPKIFVDTETIGKLEKLAEKEKSHESFHRRLLEIIDDMKRFQKAQALAELYLSILNKWA